MGTKQQKTQKIKPKELLEIVFLDVPNTENYKFKNRKCNYYSEKCEISPEELSKINSIKKTKVTAIEIPIKEYPVKVIIDTDIGTDLDDGLALLYALHNEKIEILGITTNYGPTKLRSAIVSKICETYWKNNPNAKKFPIISGFPFPMGTHRKFFFAGNEGVGIFKDEKEILEISGNWFNYDKNIKYNNEASDFIIKMCNENNNLTLISIGIPTNIGYAMKKNPKIALKIREVVIMGVGSFLTESNKDKFIKYSPNPKDWYNEINENPPFELPKNQNEGNEFLKEGKPTILFPNHNLSGDTLASKIIFATKDLKIRIIPHNVTSKFFLTGKSIDFLCEKVNDFEEDMKNNKIQSSSYVGKLLEAWFNVRRGNNYGQCPHDPLTVYESIYGGNESIVIYLPGTLIIHEWAAFSTFIPHQDGIHLLGVDIREKDKFLEHLSQGLMKSD